MMKMKPMKSRPIWNSYLAGAVLGVVLLITFVLTGHGLGASGAPTAIAAAASNVVAPAATEANGYLGWMVTGGNHPLDEWIVWEVLGILIGALAAAWWSGRLRLRIEGPTHFNSAGRLAVALVAGLLSGFGARVSAGCTSGLGLSGSATLAVAGFVFLIGFFVVGAATATLTRRMWK